MSRQAVRLARPPRFGNGLLRERGHDGSLLVEIEPDPLMGTRQWFNFRAQAPDGATISVVDAGATTYPYGWEIANVWVRPPGQSWQAQKPAYADGVLTFPHVASNAPTGYALFPPYPVKKLAAIAEQTRAVPDGEVIPADSASRRAPRLSLGDLDPSDAQVWIICGQHGGEHPALWFADGFLNGLLSTPARTTCGKRFHVVPIANPTGMFAGHLRTTDAGLDPNRHWGDPDPTHCAEVATLLEAMTETGVDMLLDVHTDFEMDHVYLDVLEEWMETHPQLVATRERFEHALAARSPDFAYGRRFPWPSAPSPELLAGMCAPAIERRFGATAVTMELPVGRYRNADDVPGDWTPAKSRALGSATATVIVEDL